MGVDVFRSLPQRVIETVVAQVQYSFGELTRPDQKSTGVRALEHHMGLDQAIDLFTRHSEQKPTAQLEETIIYER